MLIRYRALILALIVHTLNTCGSNGSAIAALEEYARGKAAYLDGDMPTATVRFTQAVDLDPGLHQATFMICKIAALDGRTDEAAKRLEGLLDTHPHHLDAAILRAQLFLQQDCPREAREVSTGFLEMNGSDPRLLHIIGRAYAAEGEVEKALAYLQSAAFFREQMGQIFIDLARLHHTHGLTQSAQEELRLSLVLLDTSSGLRRAVQSLLTRLDAEGR